MQAHELKCELDRIKALSPMEIKAEKIADLQSKNSRKIKDEELQKTKALDPVAVKAKWIEGLEATPSDILKQHLIAASPSPEGIAAIDPMVLKRKAIEVNKTRDPKTIKMERIAALRQESATSIKKRIIESAQNTDPIWFKEYWIGWLESTIKTLSGETKH